MKKDRFMVNPVLLAVALFIWLVLTVSTVSVLLIDRVVSAIIFFLLGLFFLAVAAGNGLVVSVEAEGLASSLMGRRVSLLRWEDVKEVGVCGTRPFHPKGSKRVGTLYIYVSAEQLNDSERFDMILKWPPRGKVYLLYSEKRLTAIQLRWGGGIIQYNTGELHIG